MTIKKPTSVFETEPLIYFLHYKLKLTPVTLGLAFFICISLSLTLFGLLSTPETIPAGYICYMKNISWSLPILVLFPFIIGLTLHYYLAIPRLFSAIATLYPSLDKQDFDNFIAGKLRWFNHPLISVISIVLVLGLNVVYFGQILSADKHSWLGSGDLLQGFLHSFWPTVNSGFTKTGLYAAGIQIILSYWVVNLGWRSFMLSWSLYDFFNGTRADGTHRFDIQVMPLHPDGACGLKGISRVAMIFNIILFLLGIYISLKVVDTLVIQGGSLIDNLSNPTILFCYVILAPLLFFLPLAAAHRRMHEAKMSYLMPLALRRDQLKVQAGIELNEKLAEEIKELDALYNKLDKSIPIWPFNFKSVETFFIAIISPLLPAVLPVITDILKSTFVT